MVKRISTVIVPSNWKKLNSEYKNTKILKQGNWNQFDSTVVW